MRWPWGGTYAAWSDDGFSVASVRADRPNAASPDTRQALALALMARFFDERVGEQRACEVTMRVEQIVGASNWSAAVAVIRTGDPMRKSINAIELARPTDFAPGPARWRTHASALERLESL
jgi:hypothetical protein